MLEALAFVLQSWQHINPVKKANKQCKGIAGVVHMGKKNGYISIYLEPEVRQT